MCDNVICDLRDSMLKVVYVRIKSCDRSTGNYCANIVPVTFVVTHRSSCKKFCLFNFSLSDSRCD